MRAGPGPRRRDPLRLRLRAHCGPARPRLLPARGPERTALRGPDPRAPGRVTRPPRARPCSARPPSQKPQLRTQGSARRGRQQVSPERLADVTHLAAGGQRGGARRGGRGAWSVREGAAGAEGHPWRGPRCPHTHQAAGRGGGGNGSPPAPPRGSIRPRVLGGARCALGRVGTAYAAGPPGNLCSGGFSPDPPGRSLERWRPRSGSLGQVTELERRGEVGSPMRA